MLLKDLRVRRWVRSGERSLSEVPDFAENVSFFFVDLAADFSGDLLGTFAGGWFRFVDFVSSISGSLKSPYRLLSNTLINSLVAVGFEILSEVLSAESAVKLILLALCSVGNPFCDEGASTDGFSMSKCAADYIHHQVSRPSDINSLPKGVKCFEIRGKFPN